MSSASRVERLSRRERASPEQPRPRTPRATPSTSRTSRGRGHLRHDAARRVPAGGPLAHRRRQAPRGRATRPSRRHLHRGRLARRQPQGRGVLRPGPGRAPPVHGHPGGLRVDPTRRRAGRGRRGAAPPGEGQHRGRLHRGQGVQDARHRGAAHHARRGRGHGGRLGASSCATTTSGCSSTPSTSSTAIRDNPDFSLRVLRAAEEAGAEAIVLCDTNGGTLPHDVERIVAGVVADFECQVGVHFHNDSGCAVANSIAAVRAGATHVQGCVNGYGERTGNADLSAAIPNLSLKLNVRTIPPDRLERLTPVVAPHRRARQHRPQPAAALRGRRPPSPTRPACTRAPSPAAVTPTSTSTRTRSATAPASSCRRWRAGRPWPSRPKSSGWSSTPTRSRGCSTP